MSRTSELRVNLSPGWPRRAIKQQDGVNGRRAETAQGHHNQINTDLIPYIPAANSDVLLFLACYQFVRSDTSALSWKGFVD